MSASYPPLIEALRDPARYPHPVRAVEVMETHISWVLLAGDYAYKIKKPVDLGFLDFSTLDKRRHYCEEELRLNRRLAPQLYLEVIPIVGFPEAPGLGGPGEPFEHAVKMVQFPQAAQLDRVAARGELRPGHIDQLASELAGFHQRIAVAGAGSPFGEPERVYEPIIQNFDQIRPRIGAALLPQLERLQDRSAQIYERLRPLLSARKRDGFIRECHGDAHLANMALLGDRVVLFDCIEFNENLRWIDVMNEIAFTVMDLDDRGHAALGRRLLNAYLELTGDYDGMRLFRFYQVYRALVRAKVAAIRLTQPGLSADERTDILARYRSYADLAERYTKTASPALIITHGLSGAGKTVLSGMLLEARDLIRVRSDVERKRLHGLAAYERSGSAIDSGLYAAGMNERTYERLAQLSEVLLESGLRVVVDAAFLRRAQRERLRAVAETAKAAFLILDLQAPEKVLRARIGVRLESRRDASEADAAVLEHQLTSHEPLTSGEKARSMVVDTSNPPPFSEFLAEFDSRLVFRP